MRVICARDPSPLPTTEGVAFSLFQQNQQDGVGRIASKMPRHLLRLGVQPSKRAWDFLAISLSVAAADHGCLRNTSPDGWTRDIQLEVAITDPAFWTTHKLSLEAALKFLTGDIWRLKFVSGGVLPPRLRRSTHRRLSGDSVCLLSGGVDSLVGAIDAAATGRRPVLVSQISKGDAKRQQEFARMIGKDLNASTAKPHHQNSPNCRAIPAGTINGLSRLWSSRSVRASATSSRRNG